MSVIYLNAAHTPRSPGGVWQGATEHGECLHFCNILKNALLEQCPRLDVRVVTGNFPFPCVMHDDLLFIFHKGINGKNQNRHGAQIFVKDTDSADTQYKAYSLLKALCGEYIRYLGVRIATGSTPFRFFVNTPTENAYLIMAGFIESARDREALMRHGTQAAAALSREILKIYKEKKDEDNT